VVNGVCWRSGMCPGAGPLSLNRIRTYYSGLPNPADCVVAWRAAGGGGVAAAALNIARY